MESRFARVIANTAVKPGIFRLWVEAPEMAAEARPGQFAMLACSDGPERLLRRPLSIQAVKDGTVAFLYAVVGAGTDWLATRSEGSQLNLLGPLGNGFSVAASAQRLLLLAGGLGVAPLTFLAEKSLSGGCQVRLLAGARTASQTCAENLAPEGCEVFSVTEDGSAGEKGLVTSLLARHLDWADQVFVCGPLPMFKALAKDPNQFGGKPVQVSLEVRMGCGLGFCYACTIKTRQGLKQVCKDGPVFELADVIWNDL